MHRILQYTATLVLAALSLASCSNSNPEPETPVTSRKTIFVFMPYTGDQSNLYAYFLNNLNDMETAVNENGGLLGCRLIAYISKDANMSHLIDFKYKKGSIVRDTLKTYTTASYTSADGMTSILNDIKRYAPAETYATIIGSHGEGWIPKYSTTRFFGGVKYQMDVSDLAQSIQQAGMRMQFIMFDDCYMSCIEVAYELRNATEHLIASTSEMMDYGMPYHKILKYLLAATPDYDSLCRDFISFYEKYPMPYATIGVTDCQYVEQMATLMRSINAAYTFNGDTEDIQDLDAYHFTPTVYFDFGSYARLLTDSDKSGKAYTEFKSLLAKLVPYSGHTKYIYSEIGYSKMPVNEFSGLTISDPSENQYALTSKTQTAWWKATH